MCRSVVSRQLTFAADNGAAIFQSAEKCAVAKWTISRIFSRSDVDFSLIAPSNRLVTVKLNGAGLAQA